MGTPPADITVVICSHTDERWSDLVAAVTSVLNQTLRPRETVVVVDHCPDLLARARAELAGVRVIESSERRGLSGARNAGVRASRGAILAFLDDDAVAAPDWLGWLARHYADRRVLGVGGSIGPRWERGRPRWFPAEFDWVVGCTYRGLPDRAAPVRNLIGASMSFRRGVFDGVGGFRSGLGRIGSNPLGCEETELCIRARQRWPDGAFVYEPRARVRHRVPLRRSGWAYFRSRCYAEGQSKARVSRSVGRKDGLSSEVGYLLGTLPRGCLRGITDAVRHRDVMGLARAAAIVAGLGLTAAGYLSGTLERPRAIPPAAQASDRPSQIEPGPAGVLVR